MQRKRSRDLGILVGSVELAPVPDAAGVLCPYAEAYPGVPAEDWEPYRALYPELFVEDGWRLPCLSYLIRSSEVTILVDTGVGPPGLWDWTAEEEGLLPASLAALGVGVDEVDVVFLTHLHIDHIGWNTDLDGVPFFPRRATSSTVTLSPLRCATRTGRTSVAVPSRSSIASSR